MILPKPLAYTLIFLPWIAAVLLVFWPIVMRFPPSGVFVVQTDLGSGSAWINPFLPSERTTQPGKQNDGWVGQAVIDDPVYFTAAVPGPYQTVEIEIEYMPIRQPLLDFGLARDAAGQQLEMHPMYSSELDDSRWVKIEKPLSAFVFNNATNVLNKQDVSSLAVWNASSVSPEVFDGPAGEAKDTRISLRGAHDFYFVPTKPFKTVFSLQAANRDKGNDTVGFRIFCGGEEIAQDAVGASGSRDVRMGKEFKHTISIPDPKHCVYRVAVVSSDDVFIRNVNTTAKHWVVGPRLNFGDVVGFATATQAGLAWTNSRHIVAETFHKEGLQTISFGNKSVALKRTHTTVRANRDAVDKGLAALKAPLGDVRIVADGYFAFTSESYFEPQPRRFNDSTQLEAEGVRAVLTDYVKPEQLQEGWMKSRFSFGLNPNMEKLRFVLSAPGIMSRSGAVYVRKITLKYKREAVDMQDWFGILRREAANAWHRF
ncbi:MAG: hypothetical protein RDU25_03610 [Patescibacteria group bacterium]|nr:hypothetical protein [Patescibacteria group bacterium]